MQFIKRFIDSKEQEIIFQSNDSVKNLDRFWNVFRKQDKYLIHDDQKKLIKYINKSYFETSVPWYLFWNSALKSRLESNLKRLDRYDSEIASYNKKFINKKKKEHRTLFCNGDIILDDDQQTAIVIDDKHNLVVAGAGSGKTEVLITRIAYLAKRKSDRIKPERILALAFQDKAAKEISERLKTRYSIDVEVRTFHSLGKKIIGEASKAAGIKQPTLKNECTEDWRYRIYIQKLFEAEMSSNKKVQNDIINFMKKYGDVDKKKKKSDFKKKEEFYRYQRSLTYTALDGTVVKSESERDILNFFLTHKLNGEKIQINYEEPAYWMRYQNEEGEEIIPKPDFYFPKYDIYLEHWAIGKNGKVPEWFSGDNPTEEYIQSMNIKKELYTLKVIALFETSQADAEKGKLHEVLPERFLAILSDKFLGQEFEIEELSYNEIVTSVWESAQFVKHIPGNISRFIVIAKTSKLYPKDIDRRLKSEEWSPKQLSFSKIANLIYDRYQKELKKGNNIDFSDMINLAADLLSNNKKLYRDVYDHILIDEYQDISSQRYELIKELMRKNSRCKLFCVGDDWQSIMGFAGSNLNYFIHFDRYFKNPARTDLTKNYRSIKTIVDAGACIIKNNGKRQIQKLTISGSEETKPILVYSSMHQKAYYYKYYEQIARHCLNKIKEYHKEKNYAYGDFMVLMRIANKNILRNQITEQARLLNVPISDKVDRPNCVRIMSVHKSKGLQARVVILLNVDKDMYGFPCEIENPDIFYPAIKHNDGLREQEERRLFYVAVTRAKEEAILYTQKCSESQFITEIKDFIKREDLSY